MGAIYSCSEDPETNRPPGVELTAAPTEGDTVRYSIPISWSGTDPDGSIIRYEYAIDPDSAFSEDEIAAGGPGIFAALIEGKNGDPDTTRITKGSGASFNWIHTRETSRVFQFSTPSADSNGWEETGRLKPTGRFYGMHAFYVRAVDDDDATSLPDKVAFTARTIAPRSKISRPRVSESFLILGDSLHVSWRAYDLDGPRHRPKGIYYALVHPIPNFICLGSCPPGLLIGAAPWTFVGADTTSLILPLEVPTSYVLAIRAVDENGVVEPFVDWRRNATLFATRADATRPSLTISFAGQSFTFPNSSDQTSIQIPARREAVFYLGCSAEAYGELCDGYRWSWDYQDLGEWRTEAQIRIPPLLEGTHILFVEARDTLGNTTRATLVLYAIEFSFDREVLMVDDCFDNLSPNDAQHDEFWEEMVSFYVANSDVPAEQFFNFSVHGPDDRGNLQPNVPLLSDLARYKTLIWENHGSGYNADTALIRSTALSYRLSTYLRAGGKLWLGGRMTVGATTPAPNLVSADLSYPKTDLGPGDWAWDFLKLESSEIRNDKGTTSAHRMHSVWSFPGVSAIYDSMVVDISKLPVLVQSTGGFSHADAIWDPIYVEAQPDFRGDIDTLYAYGSAGREVLGRDSQYHGRLTAIRWHDPDPDRQQGRIQWFGFALYYMNSTQAARTFARSLDWLREENPGE